MPRLVLPLAAAALVATVLTGCGHAAAPSSAGQPSARPSAAATDAAVLAMRQAQAAPRTRPGSCVSNHDRRASAAEVRGTVRMERLAMPAPRFWHLIASLHGSNADGAYRRLSTDLAKEPVSAIVGFDARLVLVLRALDDECRANWYSAHDPSGFGFMADDDFLYFRADTVTEGEATWDIAVATDTLPWGTIDPEESDGEGLLYVGMDAAKRHGIDEDAWLARESFPLDYETGSNTAGWPTPSS